MSESATVEPMEIARTMINLPQPLPERYAGARFRPCRWSDLYDRTKPDTWGIECKPKGHRRYTPVGWQMQVAPFANEDDAKATCKALNAAALCASQGERGPLHLHQDPA